MHMDVDKYFKVSKTGIDCIKKYQRVDTFITWPWLSSKYQPWSPLENTYCDSYPQMSLFVRWNNNLKNTHFPVTW